MRTYGDVNVIKARPTTGVGASGRRARCGSRLLLVLVLAFAALPAGAAAEQASQPTAAAAGQMTTGNFHSCAIHAGALRCWGYGGDGQLGYGDRKSLGDDDAPGSAGPVNLGPGRTAVAVSAGDVHTCALLDNGSVRCWGFGANGRLGYGNTASVGDDETPGSVPPVDLGPARTAKAISAGGGHSCALLDNDSVRCWGFGFDGRLGYNNTESIGDNETVSSAGPVDFGVGRTAKAVAAGDSHTCALLNDNTVRCWGFAGAGRLGYGNTIDVGRGCFLVNNACTPDPAAPRPSSIGPVALGSGRTVKALSAGDAHTCVVLDDDTVRCWGTGGGGRLGYGNGSTIGDDELPSTVVAPVDLGAGRKAKAITAGGEHTCAVLDDDGVRCWGFGAFGQLGYASSLSVGDSGPPGAAGPVNLGAGRTAKAVSGGASHTCARLDDDSVRCWGFGANGRLGYCKEATIGDNESPASVGPVDLGVPGIPGVGCPVAPPAAAPPAPPAPPTAVTLPPPLDPLDAALAAQASRATNLGTCLATVTGKRKTERRRAARLPAARRRAARRQAGRRATRRRVACVRLHGRVPGQVTQLTAQATGERTIQLSFRAVGTDGAQAPGAHTYLVKQSRRPIRTARAFARAPSLCKGKCSFKITRVGATITLNVTDLPPSRTLYFSIAARDNVSGRTGPRSATIKATVH